MEKKSKEYKNWTNKFTNRRKSRAGTYRVTMETFGQKGDTIKFHEKEFTRFEDANRAFTLAVDYCKPELGWAINIHMDRLSGPKNWRIRWFKRAAATKTVPNPYPFDFHASTDAKNAG